MGLSGVPSLYKAGGLQVDLEGACHGKKAQSGLGGEAVNVCQSLKRSKFRGSQPRT